MVPPLNARRLLPVVHPLTAVIGGASHPAEHGARFFNAARSSSLALG
eukprot:CAMPEP_0197926740 /NCGR_PEP_ID=MMETSP1439-20131203/99608_1 /TAXON_ID=66791 /ORGANISM="Gonyaulax spinifera, Strain CCMP409" /LENGTH=46 /DNA_ID= /DNA_START= /DNA_END= /DNA_ORIENTATION=